MNTRVHGVRSSSGSPFQIDQVRELAGFEAADAIGDAENLGRVDRDGASALSRASPQATEIAASYGSSRAFW